MRAQPEKDVRFSNAHAHACRLPGARDMDRGRREAVLCGSWCRQRWSVVTLLPVVVGGYTNMGMCENCLAWLTVRWRAALLSISKGGRQVLQVPLSTGTLPFRHRPSLVLPRSLAPRGTSVATS